MAFQKYNTWGYSTFQNKMVFMDFSFENEKKREIIGKRNY